MARDTILSRTFIANKKHKEKKFFYFLSPPMVAGEKKKERKGNLIHKQGEILAGPSTASACETLPPFSPPSQFLHEIRMYPYHRQYHTKFNAKNDLCSHPYSQSSYPRLMIESSVVLYDSLSPFFFKFYFINKLIIYGKVYIS